jgi:hypothetical protein
LAAEGADKYFFHGLCLSQVARNCGADCYGNLGFRRPWGRLGRSSETLIRQGAKMRGCAAAAATANHAVCVWVV